MKCSGPRVGPIFIRRDSTNIRSHSDRKMLNQAIHGQSDGVSCRYTAAAPTTNRSVLPMRFSTPVLKTPSPGNSLEFFRCVITDFWFSTCGPTGVVTHGFHTPMSTSAHAILPLAYKNRALDTAIFVVSAMYVGRLRDDASLRNLAMAAYPKALSRFRSELATIHLSKENLTDRKISAVAIALSLLFYEVSFIKMTTCSSSTDREHDRSGSRTVQ